MKEEKVEERKGRKRRGLLFQRRGTTTTRTILSLIIQNRE